MDDALEPGRSTRPHEEHGFVKALSENSSPAMRCFTAKSASHDTKTYAPARAGQVRDLPNIAAVNAPGGRATQRAHRHLDTGPSSHDEHIVCLHDAFDDQSARNERGKPKMCWHGADSFRKTAPRHQQTSSRLSQTPKLTLSLPKSRFERTDAH